MKGRFYWAKRTEEALKKAIHHFHQAIEVDPTYARACAGLAEGYVPLAFYGHLPATEALPKARAAARRALEIDPDLAEARTVLAVCSCFHDWDVDVAEREIRAAIQLDPKYPRARQVLAEILTVSGRFAEAEEEARRALELDPLALSLNGFMAMTCYFGRRYQAAIDHGRRTVEMDASFFPGYLFLGLAYQLIGQSDEAVTALQQARILSNNATLMVASLGGALAASSRVAEAREILRELEETSRRRYISQVFVAAIHAGLADTERALASLERAYENGAAGCCVVWAWTHDSTACDANHVFKRSYAGWDHTTPAEDERQAIKCFFRNSSVRFHARSAAATL